MFCYPSHVFHLHIIFLFLYATPANPTLFYRWSLLPSVFRFIPPSDAKVGSKVGDSVFECFVVTGGDSHSFESPSFKIGYFHFESSVVNTVLCFPASYLF